MKSKSLIFITASLILLAAVAAMSYHILGRLPIAKASPLPSVSNATTPKPATTAASAPATQPQGAWWSKPFKGTANDTEKAKIFDGLIAEDNSKPQDYYGKLIDQHGNPVVGADVEGILAIETDVDSEHFKSYHTKTDKEGLFEFTGLHGMNLGVSPKIEGYDSSGIAKSLVKPHGPRSTPTDREIITLWKLRGAEPMVRTSIHAYIPVDGRETQFNILTGQKVSDGGDLTVSLVRNPLNVKAGLPFDWTLTVTMKDGGFLKQDDPYPYQAPPEGYLPTIVVAQKASADKKWSPDWSERYDAKYYMKARGGRIYGRIEIITVTGFQPPPTLFDVGIYANPNGSRNLEFDRNKEIKAE